MSGNRLPEFVEASGTEARGNFHGVGRSRRASGGATSNAPAILPPAGKKSLGPWASYQVEFDGLSKDPFRRRSHEPMLGPLSYSVPVTPQGTQGTGENTAWDGGAADLAREAAEGWSVPPMPYTDDMVAGTSFSSQYPPSFMMTATGNPILEYPPSLAALIGAHESSQAARVFLPRNGGGVEGKAGAVAPTRARKRGATDGAPFTHARAQAPPVCSPLSSASPPQAYGGGRSRGEPGPEAGGGVTPIEGMLQKMADACRQAGVVLDPSLANQLDTVLARQGSPAQLSPTHPPTSAAQTSRASPIPMLSLPPSHPEISRAPSAETASPSLPSARAVPAALGTRAENPWGWAAEEGGGGPGVSRGAAGGAGGERFNSGSQSVSLPPPRDRLWTVPSPYHSLDEKLMAARCIPEFRLGGGLLHRGKEPSEVVTSVRRETSRASWKGGKGRRPDISPVTAEPRLGRAESTEALAAAAAVVRGPRDGLDALVDIERVMMHRAGGSGAGNISLSLEGNRRTTVWPQSDSESFGRDDGAGLRERSGSRQPSSEWGDDGEERRESASVSSSPMGAVQDVEAEAEIEVEAESLETPVAASYPQDVPVEGPRETEREEGTPCKEIPAFVDVEDDMDEWDDDLDPGYTVLAVSEDEFLQGQYELSSIHDNQEEGLVGEGCRGGRDSDVSQDPLPQQAADRRAFEDTTSLVGECVPSRGGEDGGRRRGVEGGASPSAEGAGIEGNSRRSWASASTGAGDLIQFSGGEDSPPRRRASDVIGSPNPPDRGRLVGNTLVAAAATQATAANGIGLIRARSQGDNLCAIAATAVVPTEGVETGEQCRGARGGGALRSEPPWQLFGRRIGGRELGGEEGYGNGPSYERDLQKAVTLLENGGFGLDRGEEAGAWRDDSFSESPSSPVDEDRSGGRGANDGEGSNRGRSEAGGISSGAGALAADCRDLNGNDAHHFQTAAVVKTMSLGGGSGGWGSGRARRGVDDARESAGPVDRGGYEGGNRAGGGACAASGGPDGSPLRCNHDLVFAGDPAAGSAGPNGRTRGGGALGNFDHASSMWPCPARLNFSYNPQGYDGENAGLLHRGPTAVEGGAGRQNSARSSLDEGCYRDCGGQASGTHDHPAHAITATVQQQLEWKELRPPCSVLSSTSGPRPPPPPPSPVDADAAGTSASASASMSTTATATTSTKANPRRDDVLLDFGSEDEDETGEPLFTVAGKRVLATAAAATARGKTAGKGNVNATLGGVSGRECGVGGAASCIVPAAGAARVGTCAGGAAALSPRSRSSDSESGNWDDAEFAMGAQEKDGRVSRTSSRSPSFSPLRAGVASAGGRGKREAIDPVGEDGALVARRRGGEGEGDEEEVDEALDELGTFNLRIVFAKGKTGFQESKEFNWPEGAVVADRYEVCGYIGKAAFSTALECRDLRRRRGDDAVCLKVIRNNKDFFDQSLDEIKLLQLIKEGGDPDEHHVLHMLDFFYFEEHLVIVSELLGDNLYEFSKAVKEAGHPEYFTLPRVCKITRQCLEALSYVNSLGLVHCDVKPENILLSNYGKAEVKLVDFGSSCFLTDRLTPYTQSRSYRAPEVILGLPYGAKVDVWSLGAVVAELLTGHVLLQSESVQTMLARIQGIIGPFPRWMLMEGEDAPKYFTPDGHVYQRMVDDADLGSNEAGSPSLLDGPSVGDRLRSSPSLADESTARLYAIIYPKKTSLKRRLRVNDEGFLEFVSTLLSVDPTRRPLAEEALDHEWIVAGMSYTDEELWYPPDDDRGGAEGETMGRDGDGDGDGDDNDQPPRVREEPGGHLMMTRRHSS